MEVIWACSLPNGSVMIMRIVDGSAIAVNAAKWESTSTATIASMRQIQEADIPPECRSGNRTYRDAVVDRGNRLEVHMPKARQIHKALMAAKGRNISDAELNAATTIDQLKAL